MINKKIVQVGNPIIRKRAKKVTDPKTKIVKRIIKDLTDSMRHHQLVGMAASQIGEEYRIFVTEVRETKHRKMDIEKDVDALRVFINPRILSFSKKEVSGWEGCGSVAESNIFGKVYRPTSLIVEALDENGENFHLKATNLLARIIQHEIDHLNGVVFTDKADERTYMSESEYRKMQAKK